MVQLVERQRGAAGVSNSADAKPVAVVMQNPQATSERPSSATPSYVSRPDLDRLAVRCAYSIETASGEAAVDLASCVPP